MHMHACTHARMHLHMHAFTHAHMHVHMHMHMPTASPFACQAAPRIAAAAARRRAAAAGEVAAAETEALAKALLEEEGGEAAAAEAKEAWQTKLVRWVLSILVLAAYASLLYLLALRLGWAMAPDEVALCGLLAAPVASLSYDLLLPRLLLLAQRLGAPRDETEGAGAMAPQRARRSSKEHHFHLPHRKNGARAIEAGLGVGGKGGHGAVRARHCASDLEDEMLMKAGEMHSHTAVGRRSSVGGGGATGNAGNAGNAGAASSTHLSAQREGFCGRIPRRAAEGPGSSSRPLSSSRLSLAGSSRMTGGGRLSPPRSRTIPEPNDALNA